ncbi:MAG: hypothetical protein KTR13_02515 [Saprospiraceae bacterium]|nr:hypothetical protein [Saprospiraceae bacterium]
MKLLNQLKVIHHRLTHAEYWPFWIFYGPFIPVFLYYGLRNGSIFHFLAVNPGIKNSGCFNFSKYSVIEQLPQQYLPKGMLLSKAERHLFQPEREGYSYPFIVKPDRGNRGRGVELVENEEQLQKALQKDYDFIIQEYIDYPLEFGVFYYHNSKTGEKGITGITSKDFLQIVGDGKSTFEQLLRKNPRSKPNLDHFQQKFAENWHKIPENGEKIIVEEIGNHSRGTCFLDASFLQNTAIEERFFDLASHIDGFYWGRFDVKAATNEDLATGAHLKILEVNGGSSEPSHMFDPGYKWVDMARFILQHLKLHYGVVKANIDNGADVPSFKTFYKEVKQYFSLKEMQIT